MVNTCFSRTLRLGLRTGPRTELQPGPSAICRGTVLCLAVLLVSSCGATSVPGEQGLRILSWNLQTLFDGSANGTEYEDFSDASLWDEAASARRLASLRPAFEALAENGPPDVMILLEVENEGLLGALRETCLGARGYRYQAWAGGIDLALGMGVLSRYALDGCVAHQVQTAGEEADRPVFECLVQAPGGALRLFVCHWKSKLGGADETEARRRQAAQLVNRRLAELSAAKDPVPCIVAGDLNVNIDEFSRRGGVLATALLPPLPEALRLPGAELCLLVDREAGESNGRWVFMSPWLSSHYEGSFHYGGAWETIDHLLASVGLFDGTGWEYRGFMVFDTEPFTRDGLPFRFNAATGLGLSDHLPIAMDLVRVAEELP